MVTHTFIDLDLEDARYLADLTGIKVDLQSTIRLCNLLIKRFEASDYESDFLDAMSTAILVRYSRPFVSGVRRKIRIEDVHLDKEEIKKHNWLLEMRNKHIAHSVNAFEENKVVGYYVRERPEEKGITSISVQHGRIISLSYADVKALIELANKILAYVGEEIKKEKSKVLALVQQRDFNELLRLSKQTAFNPSMAKVDKRRK